METLFIFDDGASSTFFLYDLNDGNNRLIHFAPIIPIKQFTLGQLFVRETPERFMEIVSIAFGRSVSKYLIVTKSEGLAAVREGGLNQSGHFLVENPSAFTAVKNGKHYPAGPLSLNQEEIEAYISWQIDDDGDFCVFTRQEDVIRLLKKKLLKPKLSTITKNIGTVNSHTRTNLGMRDMLKLGSGYLAKGDARMLKTTVPSKGSYQLSGTFPYQLGQIDWEKNEIQLRKELR